MQMDNNHKDQSDVKDPVKKLTTYTLGCKVNQYETQAIIELFEEAGYTSVSVDDVADVLIINTCTVTSMSDRKSRQMIRRARKMNPQAVVAVTGCYAQLSPEEVKKLDGVQVVAGTNQRHRLLDAVEAVSPTQECPVVLVEPHRQGAPFEPLSVNKTNEMTRAYVKIQDGCNQFCSYCIIPYARGPIRSRDKKEVIEEITRLVNHGYQEVVLTGIHLASYGKDMKKPDGLIELLESIDDIKGLKRMRLGSLEPTLMDRPFVARLMKLKTLCQHFHLSLQSGCDKTLNAMNRKYTTEAYAHAVDLIRQYDSTAAITTDIIVGFPGETEEDFNRSLEFVRAIGFADVHVFRYSPRAGTPAALYENQVSEETKNLRSKTLALEVETMKNQYLSRFIGQEADVLMEKKSSMEGRWMEGHTRHYTLVVVPQEEKLLHHEVRVKITGVENGHCKGILL